LRFRRSCGGFLRGGTRGVNRCVRGPRDLVDVQSRLAQNSPHPLERSESLSALGVVLAYTKCFRDRRLGNLSVSSICCRGFPYVLALTRGMY
jgi:hypothetical protein